MDMTESQNKTNNCTLLNTAWKYTTWSVFIFLFNARLNYGTNKSLELKLYVPVQVDDYKNVLQIKQKYDLKFNFQSAILMYLLRNLNFQINIYFIFFYYLKLPTRIAYTHV